MALTPAQILSINSGGGAGGSSVAGLISRARSSQTDPILDALAQEPEEKPGKSFMDSVKSGLGGAVSTVGRAAAAGSSAATAGAVELGDVLRDVAGKETFGSKGGASWQDVKDNFNRRVQVGDVLRENTATADLPSPVITGLGLAGDIAIDPLNTLTLGPNAVARAGLKKVSREGGEEAARILTREGPDAANDFLVRQATADAAAATADEAAALSRLGDVPRSRAWATEGVPVAGRTPSLLDDAAGKAAGERVVSPRSVEEILGGTRQGTEKMLRAIDRTGKGGIGVDLGKVGAKVGIDKPLRYGSEAMHATPAVGTTLAMTREAADWAKTTKAGTVARKALGTFTVTKDKFNSLVPKLGDHIADAMPGVHIRSRKLVDLAKADIETRLKPLLEASIDSDKITLIRNALDTGGLDVAQTRRLLTEDPDALRLLDELVLLRDETYNNMLAAGYTNSDMLPKEEYLRHRLSDEGLAALGIKKAARRGPSPTSLKERIRPGSISAQNAADDAVKYVDDPAQLAAESYIYSAQALGRSRAVDALEAQIKKIRGANVSDVIRTAPDTGFTQVAPDKWVADEIAKDMFNISRAGAEQEVVRAWDTLTSLLKEQTLFNVLAFPPYVMQNIATGVGMAFAKLGVGPQDYIRAVKLRSAIREAAEGGAKGFDAELGRLLPDPDDFEVAKSIYNDDIVGGKRPLFDTGADEVSFDRTTLPVKVGSFGTKNTAAANQWVEETMRSAAYIRSLDNGLDTNAAADMVRSIHLEYSGIGRTRLERDVINRFVFFPTWLMRAPTAIVRAYSHSPAMLNNTARLEMGSGWHERERNEYGELMGPRLSGPASFATGLPFEAGEVDEFLNPLANAFITPEARSFSDVVPPLGGVLSRGETPAELLRDRGPSGRLGGVLEGLATEGVEGDNARRSRYLRSLVGVRTGADYGGERAVENLNARIAERESMGGTATPHQTLAMRAVDIIGPEAAGMRLRELVEGLIGEGVTTAEIRRILNAPYKSVERAALPNVNVDSLLAQGKSVEEISELLRAG